MKIVVVADSHGNLSLLSEIFQKHYDADIFYHLGDSELPGYYLNHFCAVRGNCDYNDLPRMRDVEVLNYKIHLEHGDNFHLMLNSEKYITSLDCDIFLFGHTHKKLVGKVGKTYVFNPGSLTRPRDGEKGSYLILEINEDSIKHEFMFVD